MLPAILATALELLRKMAGDSVYLKYRVAEMIGQSFLSDNGGCAVIRSNHFYSNLHQNHLWMQVQYATLYMEKKQGTCLFLG